MYIYYAPINALPAQNMCDCVCEKDSLRNNIFLLKKGDLHVFPQCFILNDDLPGFEL